MKRFCLILLLLLTACKPAEEARDTVSDGAKTTVGQVERSEALSDLTNATQALQTYFLTNSKFPATLAELDLRLHNPSDLQYDPKTGKVRSKTYPDL